MLSKMTTEEAKLLRAEFIRFLTVDSETQDGRRKEFNQAIFMPDYGHPCFYRTDLYMVLEKFDRAISSIVCRKSADIEG